MPKNDVMTVPVAVNLTRSDYEAIGNQVNAEPARTIEKICNYMLPLYAQGAIMLEPPHLERILKAKVGITDATITSLEVAKYIEKTKGIEDGMNTVRAQIDPALYPPLEEIAKAQGVSLREMVSDAMNLMLNNGWLYEAKPEGGTIHLTGQNRADMERLIGKSGSDITGADVIKALKAVQGAAA